MRGVSRFLLVAVVVVVAVALAVIVVIVVSVVVVVIVVVVILVVVRFTVWNTVLSTPPPIPGCSPQALPLFTVLFGNTTQYSFSVMHLRWTSHAPL
jgi:hypothetical protein